MKLKIEIKMDNAAFEDDPSIEAGRILKDLGTTITERTFGAGFRANIYDINGNCVGEAKVTR